VLHFFGRMPTPLLQMAQRKGMKVVLADLLAGQGSRPAWRLQLQRLVLGALRRTTPRAFIAPFNWESYRIADVCLALTSWEARLMADLFGTPLTRIHVLPNGVEAVFLNQQPIQRGLSLVCTATIRELKRTIELAEAAVLAQTPLWIIGKPYAESDPYAQRFVQLARRHASIIRYEGAIADRAKLARVYLEARGFVLLSTVESLSLSALEAAACECPCC
jgi:glycosyltransferase involved in cell wall biosynthesis